MMKKRSVFIKRLTSFAALAVCLAAICALLTGCMLGGGDLTTPAVTDTSPAAPSTSEVTEPTTSGRRRSRTTPPDTEPLPPPDKVISFAACGDNILYRPAIWEAKDRAKAGGRTYNFRPIYKNVESVIAAADVAFINQETVIAGAEYGYTGYPLFNSPRDIADDLVDMGFDIVSLANNHILDMREQGLYNTIKYWNGCRWSRSARISTPTMRRRCA